MEDRTRGPASAPHPQALLTTNPMVTTALELPGHRIVQTWESSAD